MILASKSAKVFNMHIHVLSSRWIVHVIKRKAVNVNNVGCSIKAYGFVDVFFYLSVDSLLSVHLYNLD